MNDTYNITGDNINLATGHGKANQGTSEQAAPAAPPNHLPALDTHFLGRDKELADLLKQLRPGKVITVCGPGGMGKSALAAQVAHKLEKARFPDGILFHSFYNQPDTGAALEYIAGAFGMESTPTPAAAAQRALAGRKALLILDGTEEADDLKAVLDLRGSCGVLITSRRREDSPGERLDLQPLRTEAAAQLLRAWIGVASDPDTVERICTRLGNWPVALRIAGHYLRSADEPASEYLGWLETDPLPRLDHPVHRHDSVSVLLRRSLEQVSEDARTVLGIFGVLAFAPVAKEPVTAVLDDDAGRCRSALNGLVNFGLLVRSDDRWQTSHALVHTYARTELALSKESLEWLSWYYVACCDELSGAGLKGYARLDGERAHCLRLMESCLNSGLWTEVQALAEAIREYLDRQGYWAEQLTALNMTLTAARKAGDRKNEGVCLGTLGYTYHRRGEYEQALQWNKQSLAIACEQCDRKQEGVVLNNIGWTYDALGKHEQALEQYQQSLAIWQEGGDQVGEGATLDNIGQLYYAQGDYETALKYYKQCLPIRREAGDKIGEGSTLNNIALIYRKQSNFAKALEYLRQALAILYELGDRVGETEMRWNIGRTYEDLDDPVHAEAYIQQVVQIAEAIDHPALKRFHEGLKRVRANLQAK